MVATARRFYCNNYYRQKNFWPRQSLKGYNALLANVKQAYSSIHVKSANIKLC